MSTQDSSVPQQGWAGLKHWRHDALAGFQVALLWTPFSLGVALASGAPAVAGLISAIVAGLLYPFLGGSHVTVSGPAAALAPVLLWGMLTLGHGDLAAGYPLVLVAIVLTGVLQLLLSVLKAGRYASLLPVTVVEAMLASIGIMIIVRQIPALFGAASVPSKSMVEAITRLPEQLMTAQAAPAFIGLAALAVMFGFRRLQHGIWRWIPAAIVASALGALLGWLFELPAALRISVPERLLDGMSFPAFGALLAQPDIWLSMLLVVLTFTMIDGVESVASVKAVDKIDPWHRKSDANKTLRAMGVCNMTSGFLGGLTVIPNAVPSRANIDAGARTLWSNFYSGIFLLIFATVLASMLMLIPLSAIAAILIYIGWRLCEPAVFARMAAIGRDRILIFAGTVVAILLTDLLRGMLIGVAMELLLLMYLQSPSLRWSITGKFTLRDALGIYRSVIVGMFRSPVIKIRTETVDGRTRHLVTMGSMVGFNTLHVEDLVARLPAQGEVVLRFTESARLLDHTAMEFLQHLEEELAAAGRRLTVEGLDALLPFASHPLASRLQDAEAQSRTLELDDRASAMAELAQRLGLAFAPALRATVNREGFIYLRRGDQREERNTLEGPYRGVQWRVFDYSHTAAPDYHMARRHTLLVATLPQPLGADEVVVITPGHYLERYLVELQEVAAEGQGIEGHLIYSARDAVPAGVLAAAGAVIARHGELYWEWRKQHLLVFAPSRGWETPSRIQALLDDIAPHLLALAQETEPTKPEPAPALQPA